jgi:hypothetical protein
MKNGLILGQQYIGSIKHYQIKRKQYDRCQRFDYLAWLYKERARCRHCAGEHERRNYTPGVSARCLDWNGAHPTEDRSCQRNVRQPFAMLTKTLRLIQLNIMKSRSGMKALINNPQTQNLGVLFIQEPSITALQTHVNHSTWRLYQPTYEEDGAMKRSLLYVNKRISTSPHRHFDAAIWISQQLKSGRPRCKYYSSRCTSHQ